MSPRSDGFCVSSPKPRGEARGVVSTLVNAGAPMTISDMLRLAAAVAALSLTSCGDSATPTYTLYRNSELGTGDRIHWATFDAADKGAPSVDALPYNQGNCEFAAQVLNANLRRLAAQKNAEPDVRFWCEQGRYRP